MSPALSSSGEIRAALHMCQSSTGERSIGQVYRAVVT